MDVWALGIQNRGVSSVIAPNQEERLDCEQCGMSIELMLNGVNLSFVTFAHQWHQVKGQIFVFFVMVVAAAEAAVGLAIIIAVFRARATLAVDRIDLMKL